MLCANSCGLRLCWAATLLGIIFMSPLKAAIVYTEDFEDDNIPGAPGFASSVFSHLLSGPNAFLTVPHIVPPSPRHVLFLGAVSADSVGFTLNPGERVEAASLWMTGTGGGWSGVTFNGTLGSLNFTSFLQDSFQLVSVDPSSGIGDVVSIVLGVGPPLQGQEAYYDDISIRVVPEASSGLLALVGLVGLRLRRK